MTYAQYWRQFKTESIPRSHVIAGCLMWCGMLPISLFGWAWVIGILPDLGLAMLFLPLTFPHFVLASLWMFTK